VRTRSPAAKIYELIVLDTNASPETLKPAPSDIVVNWLAWQEPLSVFTTAVTQAEILQGIEARRQT